VLTFLASRANWNTFSRMAPSVRRMAWRTALHLPASYLGLPYLQEALCLKVSNHLFRTVRLNWPIYLQVLLARGSDLASHSSQQWSFLAKEERKGSKGIRDALTSGAMAGLEPPRQRPCGASAERLVAKLIPDQRYPDPRTDPELAVSATEPPA
jgi:hypothetical protein